MRLQRFVSSILALLLLSPIVFGQPTTCDTQALLEAYVPVALAKERKTNEDITKAKLRIAAYDHLSGTWTAWQWKEGTLTEITDEDDWELPHTNEPTLVVPSNYGVMVVAVNTVPSLYSTKLTASTESDIEGIADLQRLAGLLGNFVTTGVSSLADVAPASAALTTRNLPGFEIQTHAKSMREKARLFEVAKSDVEQLGDDLNAVIEFLHAEATALAARNAALKKAARTTGDAGTALAASRDEAIVHLQARESGSAAAQALPDLTNLDQRLLTAFADLRAERDAAAALPAACPAMIQLLDRALVWQLDGEPKEAAPALRFGKEWREALDTLRNTTGKCPSELVRPLARISSWLEKNRPIPGGVTGPLRTTFLSAREQLFDFTNAHAQRDTLTATATEMLGKRAAALKQATQLGDLARLTSDTFFHGNCGLLRVQRVEGRDLNLPWTKVRNEEFSINIRPTFASEIERRRGDVAAAKYHFTRREWDIDVDTAVIYTDIQDSEYHVIDTNPNEDTETFVVAEKARETRAGDLAVLLTAKPKGFYGGGLQFGFGFDTSNPAVFLGLGFALGDYVKISGGRTWQRITKLGEGYALGGNVRTSTDLSTREAFDNDWYLALSITLDNLPIFKQPQ